MPLYTNQLHQQVRNKTAKVDEDGFQQIRHKRGTRRNIFDSGHEGPLERADNRRHTTEASVVAAARDHNRIAATTTRKGHAKGVGTNNRGPERGIEEDTAVETAGHDSRH